VLIDLWYCLSQISIEEPALLVLPKLCLLYAPRDSGDSVLGRWDKKTFRQSSPGGKGKQECKEETRCRVNIRNMQYCSTWRPTIWGSQVSKYNLSSRITATGWSITITSPFPRIGSERVCRWKSCAITSHVNKMRQPLYPPKRALTSLILHSFNLYVSLISVDGRKRAGPAEPSNESGARGTEEELWTASPAGVWYRLSCLFAAAMRATMY